MVDQPSRSHSGRVLVTLIWAFVFAFGTSRWPTCDGAGMTVVSGLLPNGGHQQNKMESEESSCLCRLALSVIGWLNILSEYGRKRNFRISGVRITQPTRTTGASCWVIYLFQTELKRKRPLMDLPRVLVNLSWRPIILQFFSWFCYNLPFSLLFPFSAIICGNFIFWTIVARTIYKKYILTHVLTNLILIYTNLLTVLFLFLF